MHDEVFGIIADVLPVSLVEYNRASGTLLEQVSEVLTSERRVAAEEGISDDAHGPHVRRFSVALAVHDLGGSISK